MFPGHGTENTLCILENQNMGSYVTAERLTAFTQAQVKHPHSYGKKCS